LLSLKKQILELDRMIMAWHRSNETSRRLHYIPGVGPLLAPLWWRVSLIQGLSDQAVPSRLQ
jgi:transposase